jgi:TRAP-type C4-dicarboxylate transport system permease small subunit
VSETHRPRSAPAGWQRFARIITRIEIGIGAVALIAILTMVFLQALQRYLPGDGIAWTGELARFSLIWVTFAAAGVLVTTNGHIALELIDSAPNRDVVRWVQVFALLVVAATGAGLAVEAFALIDSQGIIKSPVLRVPMSIVYIPVLIGVLSTTIRALVTAFLVAKNGPMLPDYDADELPEVAA